MVYKKQYPLIGTALVVSCSLLLTGCPAQKSNPPGEQSKVADAAAPPRPLLDACTLLTSDDIQSVQGEPITETRPDRKISDGLAIAQCFYTLPSFNRSVSLVLVQKDIASGSRRPVQEWKEMFASEKMRETETDAGKKKLPPMRIADLGEEAFWVGNNIIGALHVLQGDSYITLSVGGPEEQAVKIEKAKSLARLILPRL